MADYEGRYLGQQFGNYRLVKLLGWGGFAEVYLGEHIHLHTKAAVKVLTGRLTREEIEHFRREASTVFDLCHQNIARILEYDLHSNIPFIVMEYAAKGSLRDQHPHGARVPLPTVVEYVKQVAVSWSPDGRYLASTCQEIILVWDFTNRISDPVFTYRNHSSDDERGVNDPMDTVVAWSPNGSTIASAWRETVEVWDALTGNNIQSIPVPNSLVTSITWLPNNRLIAFGLEDRRNHADYTVQLWEATGERYLLSYKAHLRVNSIASLPDSQRIAFCSSDTVQIWEAPTPKHLFTYQGHTDSVTDVAWSPDGQRIASCSRDGTVQVWQAV